MKVRTSLLFLISDHNIRSTVSPTEQSFPSSLSSIFLLSFSISIPSCLNLFFSQFFFLFYHSSHHFSSQLPSTFNTSYITVTVLDTTLKNSYSWDIVFENFKVQCLKPNVPFSNVFFLHIIFQYTVNRLRDFSFHLLPSPSPQLLFPLLLQQ